MLKIKLGIAWTIIILAIIGEFILFAFPANAEIIESTLVKNDLQFDGLRAVKEVHKDQTGKEHVYCSTIHGSEDAAQRMLDRVPQINARLITDEAEVLLSGIEAGNMAVMDADPQHPSDETLSNRKRIFYRWLIRRVAKSKDIKFVRAVFYPLWDYLKHSSNYTAQQIADYLNISLTQLSTINKRFQAIHDNLTFIDNDESQEVAN